MTSAAPIPGRTLGMGVDTAVEGRPSVAAPFGTALRALASEDSRVLGLTADLGKYTDILPFAEAFPDRYFNVGMAEQNLIAVAAGLARTGKIPFVTTYGVFATRRAYDFIAIACAHSAMPVKIFAGLPGLTTGYGGTHQAIEDLALMSAVPGLVVMDPCDATELAAAVRVAAAHDGPVYVRLQRGNVPVVFDPASHVVSLGRAIVLGEGMDVGIVSTGLMTERALDAAATLSREGIAAGVLHVPFLKPFDEGAVAAFAASTKRLVIAENHLAYGGLATRVVETLYAARIARPIVRIGLPDRFIECGSTTYLQDKYGLSTTRMIERARSFVQTGAT